MRTVGRRRYSPEPSYSMHTRAACAREQLLLDPCVRQALVSLVTRAARLRNFSWRPLRERSDVAICAMPAACVALRNRFFRARHLTQGTHPPHLSSRRSHFSVAVCRSSPQFGPAVVYTHTREGLVPRPITAEFRILLRLQACYFLTFSAVCSGCDCAARRRSLYF